MELDVPRSIDEVRQQYPRSRRRSSASAKGRAHHRRDGRAACQAATPSGRAVRPRAIVLNPNGFTVGPGSLVDEIMTRAGLENVAATLKIGNYGQMPLEIVVTKAIDVLIVSASRDGPPAIATEMLKHPVLSRISGPNPGGGDAEPAVGLRRPGGGRGGRTARARRQGRPRQGRAQMTAADAIGTRKRPLGLPYCVVVAAACGAGCRPARRVARDRLCAARHRPGVPRCLARADRRWPRSCCVELRLPRALLGRLVGFSLGITGAAMQGLMRNPLAEPGIIGVSGYGGARSRHGVLFRRRRRAVARASARRRRRRGGGNVPALRARRPQCRHHDADPRRRRDQQLCRRAHLACAQSCTQSVRGRRDRLLAAGLARGPQPALCLAGAAADAGRVGAAAHVGAGARWADARARIPPRASASTSAGCGCNSSPARRSRSAAPSR